MIFFRKHRTHTFFTALLLFWFFSSVPRIWFYVLGEINREALKTIFVTLGVGFLNDGIFVGILLLLLQLTNRFFLKWPQTLLAFSQILFCFLLASLLALMMLNVEFFRYFGSNSNMTHVSFLLESETLLSSFLNVFTFQKIAVSFLVVPGLYMVLCYFLAGFEINRTLQKPVALIVPVILILGGLGVQKGVKQNNPINQNLQANYILSFVSNALGRDEIRGLENTDLASILDTKPLPDDRSPSPDWHFFDKNFPLVKGTDHHLCALGLLSDSQCLGDKDGDGYPVKLDCNDNNSAVFPGADDVPGNAIDEDCSGLDNDPPSIIFIHWEGARAVNVGSLGYSDPVTPRFDALAKKGRLYRKAYANGTQTRWSLTSVYNSILPRLSSKWIFKHNPDLNLLAFPEILGRFGYQTFYFHSGDLNFGNLDTRIKQWFEVVVDRKDNPIKSMPRQGWGPRDKDLYDFVYKTLKERTDKRPFFTTVATLSVHHPFLLPDEKLQAFPPVSKENMYKNALRYADEQLGLFVEKVMADKQFNNTIILIASDHGINAGRPHPTWSQSILWEDLVWIPLLLIDRSPNLKIGMDDDVRQLADIGPTVLDRLGIVIPNHFIGHSLYKSYPAGREGIAFFGNANGGISAGFRKGGNKFVYFLHQEYSRLFNLASDPKETTNLCFDGKSNSLCDTNEKIVTSVYVKNNKLINENRIWSWKYWKK